METAIAAVLALLLGAAVAALWLRKGAGSRTRVDGTLEHIRSMGDLVVLSAHIKEVVTMKTPERWFTSPGKILLICPFDVEFRYDLRRAKVAVNDADFTVVLPPLDLKTIPRDIEFYDERKEKILGWPRDFDLEVRNQMLRDAHEQALAQSRGLTEKLQFQARHSLQQTLNHFLAGFGIQSVNYVFTDAGPGIAGLSDAVQGGAAEVLPGRSPLSQLPNWSNGASGSTASVETLTPVPGKEE